MPENPTGELSQLINEEWAFRLIENPTFATQTGDHRYNDRLPGMKETDFARREQALKDFLHRLGRIERSALSAAEQINYDFFERELSLQLRELAFGTHWIPITKMYGLLVSLPDIVLVTPFRTVEDYEMYLARLRGFAALADETVALMRAGIAKGVMPSRRALAGVVEGFRMHAGASPEASIFYQPILSLPASIEPSDRNRLCAAAREAIAQSIAPGYCKLADYIETEYLPAIPHDLDTPRLLGGDQYYAYCVNRYTSLDISPEAVHQTGLSEVARIRGEMDELMRSVGFTGSLRQFSDQLRADPKFFVDTPEQLMKEVAYLMKRIEGQLPALFKTLPRTPFGMREIPAYLAPTSTSAYYFLPAGDGTTAGFYYVNTYDLKSRPLYEYEALSLHEAVPGHHLQLALALELPNVPSFRKWGETTAFIEGWALYAERLGLEMGFYRDPYANFGRLVYEMWRAARLVVDTGLHAFGWTRQQAIDYLADNTALSLLNIENEVDRYIAWPGQAVAYKIGEIKIRELRRRAEETLGPRFDVRAFHDVLLLEGGIPLDVLEARVLQWIAAQAA
jgi:prolyl oligopeptidase